MLDNDNRPPLRVEENKLEKAREMLAKVLVFQLLRVSLDKITAVEE